MSALNFTLAPVRNRMALDQMFALMEHEGFFMDAEQAELKKNQALSGQAIWCSNLAGDELKFVSDVFNGLQVWNFSNSNSDFMNKVWEITENA